MSDQTDPELRRMLHGAVDDLEPTRSVDDVRAARTTSRSWVPATVAAGIATALVLVGLPWLVGRGEEAPPSAAPAEPAPVLAFATVEGPQGRVLVADRRSVTAEGDPLVTALRETLFGAPADPDYTSLLPSGATGEVSVTGSEDDGLLVTVEAADGAIAPEDADLVAGALRLTAGGTGLAPETVVSVSLDGAPPTRDPVSTAYPSLAAVVVESVGDDESVTGAFTVSGLAATFEGTVTWRLLDGGRVVREGFTTATQCCTPSPYAFDVEAPAGEYVLEVGETDPSGGEGFPAYVETKRVSVE